LLLRLAVSTSLIASPQNDESWSSVIAAIAGVLLIAGLWTPISAGVAALLEFWIAIRMGDARSAHFFAAAIAVSLTVLGPGAWSIDARLFGRRRISIDDR
jgi:uncharacterized membrane protein YphA (DoxX/SURF4 family)